MRKLAIPVVIIILLIFLTVVVQRRQSVQPGPTTTSPIVTTGSAQSIAASARYSNDQWRALLTPEQYNILREAGTEVPFTGALLHEKRRGTYVTADCHDPVFRSEQKYDSGTGWPSFWAPIKPGVVVLKTDSSLGITRTEVLSRCGGHLGHVFDDGPQPTSKRYCMNSAALEFIPDPGQ